MGTELKKTCICQLPMATPRPILCYKAANCQGQGGDKGSKGALYIISPNCTRLCNYVNNNFYLKMCWAGDVAHLRLECLAHMHRHWV